MKGQGRKGVRPWPSLGWGGPPDETGPPLTRTTVHPDGKFPGASDIASLPAVANVDEPPAQGRYEKGPITVVTTRRGGARTGYRPPSVPVLISQHSTAPAPASVIPAPSHRRHSRKTHIGIGTFGSSRRNYRAVILAPRSHQERRREGSWEVGGLAIPGGLWSPLNDRTFPAPKTSHQR